MFLEKIFSNPIFHILLKNDSIFYGECVRKLIFNELKIDELIKNDVNITCLGNILYKDIIERDLHKYIIQIKCKKNNCIYGNKMYEYFLKYNSQTLKLIIFYFKNSIDYLIKYNLNMIDILVDIDTLFIDRNTIGCLEIPKLYEIEPIPFLRIIQNIKNKKFKILDNTKKKLNTNNIKYLVSLLENNWTNVLQSINTIDLQDSCAICSEFHNKDSIKLSCCHSFHKKCLLNYILNLVEDVPSCDFKCPYCRQKNLIIDII